MKRLGLATFGFFMGLGSLSAQNTFEALSVSREDPVMGTARYSAMAGALGAFGANASTAKDNPAGLGVYSKWDLTLTPNVYVTNDNDLGCNINNFGFVINFGNSGNRSGYISSSFGITYNRLRNFDRFSDVRMRNQENSMTDYMHDYASDAVYNEAIDVELLDADGNSTFSPGDKIERRVSLDESGSMGEWDFSYGMNISNRFYWGVGIGLTSLDYEQKSKYDEISPNDGQWYLDNYFELQGTGFNFKLGAIARVTDFFRLGFAFHTPTFYTIDLFSAQSMGFDYVDDGREISASELTYDLQTPLKLQGSMGFVIGKRAIIGLEYQYADYSAMRFSDCEGDVFRYNEADRWSVYNVNFYKEDEKNRINEYMTASHTVKLGAEVNIANGFAVRAGLAYVTAPAKEEARLNCYTSDYPVSIPQETIYGSGGFGYRAKSFYVDAAVVYKSQADLLYDYLPADKGMEISNESLNNMNIMASIGWKF